MLSNLNNNKRQYAVSSSVCSRVGMKRITGTYARTRTGSTDVKSSQALTNRYKLEQTIYKGKPPRPDVDKLV